MHLYRPTLWWRAGRLHVLRCSADVMPEDAALLLQLARGTFHRFYHGDFMSDDVSSALRLVTPPAAEPMTLAQAKAFLRVEHTADDEAITRAIAAARGQAEAYLRVALLPQTWDYVVANACMETICLPFGPAQSITSVVQANEAGTTTTVNAANYRISVDGFSVLFYNVSSAETVTIRYVAGSYTAAANVPAMVVQGMLHHVAVMMETRDGAVPLPAQSAYCYQPYRRVML